MRFPRMIAKGQMMAFGAGGLFMLVAVVIMLMDTSFDSTPPAAIVFCCVFLAVWFALVGFMASFAIKPLETVEIDGHEIRICLGRLVLRRIPTDKIRTVGIVGFKVRVNGLYLQPVQSIVVLSFKSPQEMEKKGTKALLGRDGLSVQTMLREIGQDRNDAYRTARAYLQQKNLFNPLWLEWNDEAVAQLRRCLPCATFLFNPK